MTNISDRRMYKKGSVRNFQPLVRGLRLTYFVYILHSIRDGSLYIGSTGNLRVRLRQHHNGEVPSTVGARPLQLIFYEAFTAKTDAMRREAYFKTPAGNKSLRFNLAESIELAERHRRSLIGQIKTFLKTTKDS